ncbi:hypothetical protein SPRG_21180 [Saprolegnia parasitica CBS 223.65]|uniref:HAT C-terminal dimerisation domain-containing protein n=1 Tax=Saprolegnia parasitica (strain CBS 223.65) TaxID=695850 RepID=A0A067BVW3_SAPPC|nr:hypothetical protein SPRG_21180 [Saprolegnia parasitica CBS 223.65]KDO22423.1 hypothetical protein SPRG_21180 [Saprolegnia parasitica CBS 223.65]|eukprot:XP_012206871.1 hypothetical protein SPRG_21180 [Saprolegnia parasitica CBS 223.65]
MREKADKYQKLLASKPATIATFLDVRLPKAQAPSAEIDFIKSILDSEYPALPSSSSIAVTPVKDMSKLNQLMMKSFDTDNDPDPCELDHFVNERRVKLSADLLEWWEDHRETYPRLHRMAKDYLAVPASNVPSERANSAAKFTFQGRDNLHDCTFKAETCVRSWMKLFKRVGVPLPNNFHDAFQRLDKDKVVAMSDSDAAVRYYFQNI